MVVHPVSHTFINALMTESWFLYDLVLKTFGWWVLIANSTIVLK